MLLAVNAVSNDLSAFRVRGGSLTALGAVGSLPAGFGGLVVSD